MVETSPKIIFFRVGWMEQYKGKSNGDEIYGGGSYVTENDYGHEVFNFLPYHGYMYGYVEPPRGGNINIVRIGATKVQESIEDVLVVWVAPRKSGGVFIIGWYKNATLYRCRQAPDDLNRKFKGDMIGFRAKAKEEDCTLLPFDKRILKILMGSGGMGQSNIWYADGQEHETIRHEVLEFINSGGIHFKGKEKFLTKNNDPLERAKVEGIAVELAVDYYRTQGYEVKSVEKDNVGWDLEGYINSELFVRIEVKGLSGKAPTFELTPNEYAMMGKFKDSYRLCVVTSALSAPLLGVYNYSPDIGAWQTDEGIVLKLNEAVSARFCLK
ncbi:hypothetical protein JCM17380_16160 [Desulfosporosinus burensis]